MRKESDLGEIGDMDQYGLGAKSESTLTYGSSVSKTLLTKKFVKNVILPAQPHLRV